MNFHMLYSNHFLQIEKNYKICLVQYMYQPNEINRNKVPSDEYKIEMSRGWEGSRETGLPSVSFSFRFGGAKL